MEYAIYPFRHIRITQRYNEGNHTAHWKNFKDYADKPWDEACKDSGRSYFEPQNDFKIEEIIGNNTLGYTVRLISVNKLILPYGKTDYLKITLTHGEHDDISKLKVGQIVKKGEKILREGKSGLATGNHFHITANIGKYYGFKVNSNKKSVFAYDKSLLPEEAFYVDNKFTTILDTRGIIFKSVPTPKPTIDYDKIIKEKDKEIIKLQDELKLLKASIKKPIFAFEIENTKKYQIKLNKGERVEIYE